MLLLQLCLLIVSLWLIPLLIGGSQPAAEHVRVKFFEFGYNPQLAQEGYLTFRAAVYQNWPSLFILMAGLVDIVGITDLEPVFILTPFLLQFAFALVLYPFLRSLFGPDKANYCWAGIWIFVLANWIEQSYLGSQAYGLLLLLLILFLFIRTARQAPGSTAVGYLVCIILLFAVLVITHFLTYLVGLTMVTGLTILYRRRISFNIVWLAAILGAAWSIYQITSIFEYYLLAYGGRAFDPAIFLADFFGSAGRAGGMIGSASHIAVVLIRMLTSVIFVIITLIGIALGRLSRNNISLDNAFIAIGVGAVLVGMSGLYGGELVQRAWYFSLVVVAYFGLKLLDRRATAVILCLLLLAALPLNFIAHYGNQASDYRSPSHIAGFAFTDSTIKNVPRAEAKFNQLSLEGDILFFTPSGQPDPFPTGEHYFAISQRWDAYYSFQHGKPEFVDKVWAWAQNSVYYDSIYANPEYNLYIHYGVRPPEGINIAQPELSP